MNIYEFPTDDETVSEVNTSMNSHIPFAVVGSTEFVRVGNKMMRSRQYPWGTVQGEMRSVSLHTSLYAALIFSKLMQWGTLQDEDEPSFSLY